MCETTNRLENTEAALKVLRQTGALIFGCNRERWTQERDARDRNREGVSPYYTGAECWCLHGAVRRAAADLGLHDSEARNIAGFNALFETILARADAASLTGKADAEHPDDLIITWNDRKGRSPAEVREVLNTTIERLEKPADRTPSKG